MSFTATKSMSMFRSQAARNRFRPMRPKPLMPTFTAIHTPPVEPSLTGFRAYQPLSSGPRMRTCVAGLWSERVWRGCFCDVRVLRGSATEGDLALLLAWGRDRVSAVQHVQDDAVAQLLAERGSRRPDVREQG